jgi:hypothetical protein
VRGAVKLQARGSQIKLSHFNSVVFRAWQRPDRFHARRHAPPLHSSHCILDARDLGMPLKPVSKPLGTRRRSTRNDITGEQGEGGGEDSPGARAVLC